MTEAAHQPRPVDPYFTAKDEVVAYVTEVLSEAHLFPERTRNASGRSGVDDKSIPR